MGYMKELDIRTKAAQARVFEAMRDAGIEFHDMSVVGSFHIECKNTSDIDIVVYIKPDVFALSVGYLSFDGWTIGGAPEYEVGDDSHWRSWKRVFSDDAGEVNMLVTTDEQTYQGFVDGSEVCRLLHLARVPIPRSVKCAIHELLRSGLTAEEALATQA